MAEPTTSAAIAGTLPGVMMWLWQNKAGLKTAYDAVQSWFTTSGAGIVVLGPGGVGKSTLGQFLHGDYKESMSVPGRYVESVGIEKYEITKDPPAEILVAPGQSHRRSTWNELFAALDEGTLRGIVLVSANGYHSLGDIDPERHRLHKGDDDAFLQDYLNDGLKRECEILRLVAERIVACRHRHWLLHIIAKEDLWWSKRDLAMENYQKPMSKAIRSIEAAHGNNHFRYEQASASFVIGDFVTGRGRVLARNEAGYGQAQQVESLTKLVSTLDGLRQWEMSHKS